MGFFMTFTRAEFLGLDFTWYAVDAVGQIAVLTTGYGPIPKIVFADRAAYDQLEDLFIALASRSEARVTPEQETLRREKHLNFDLFLKEARKGLFSYFDRTNGSRAVYQLIAYPTAPLTIDQLPSDCQTALERTRIADLRFAESPRLDATAHFECASEGDE